MPDPTPELARDLLDQGLPVRLRVRGGSMRPCVRDGDVVILAPDVARVGVGDLVLLPVGDFGVVLRVIARRGERVCVKGDALPGIDGWFLRRDLRARVVGIERDGRLVAMPRWRAVVLSLLTAPLRRYTTARWPPRV